MAFFEECPVIRPLQASLADNALFHVVKPVARTNVFVRMDGLHNVYALFFQDGQDGRRNLMIDHMKMGHIGPGCPNQSAQATACLGRIENTADGTDPRKQLILPAGRVEIDVIDEVFRIGRRKIPGMLHRERNHPVAVGLQNLFQFEEVPLGSALDKIEFVDHQNVHHPLLLWHEGRFPVDLNIAPILQEPISSTAVPQALIVRIPLIEQTFSQNV